VGHVTLCTTEIADNFLFTLLTSEFKELGDLQKYFRVCAYFLVLLYCRCRCSYLPFWSSFVWLIFATFVNFKPRWWTTVCQWFRRFRTRMLMQCLDLCNISGRLLYLNDNTVRMWNSQSCQWC